MRSREADAVSLLLDAGKVPEDGILVVQSGFKGLSRAGYRAEAFIEALLERMRGGTLLMPAMSWRLVSPAQPNWDELTTPSHVGILTELFRTRYAEARSIHPTHSVSGTGPAASRLLAAHELDDTPVSANSPWGRLAGEGAHILLLGVGFESCTALHHPEEVVAPDLYLFPKEKAELYACTDRGGVVHQVGLRRHLRLNRDFAQYGPRLAARGQLAQGELPGTPWKLAAAHDLLEDAFANLRGRPDAHIVPGT